MSNLVRTTITVPEPLYHQAKILAASKGESFSSFIAGLLNQGIKGKRLKKKTKDPMSTIGPFSIGIKKAYDKRGDLYDDRLKRKLGL